MLIPISIAALADSVNPCAFSVLFLTIAFLFNSGKSRRDILKVGGLYILGIYLIYLLIGLGILQALSFFGIPHAISKIGAVILILWGIINLLGELIPAFPIKLQIPSGIKPQLAKLIHSSSLPAAFALGLLVGASEFPCTGGPYLLILSLLHDKATFLSGFFYLLFYNLVFVAPLLVILTFASDPKLHDKIKNLRKSHAKTVEIISSIILVVMGALILYV